MSPTLVILLSPKDKAPAKAVIVVVPIVPPLTTSPLIASFGNSMDDAIRFANEPVEVELPLVLPLTSKSSVIKASSLIIKPSAVTIPLALILLLAVMLPVKLDFPAKSKSPPIVVFPPMVNVEALEPL